MFTFLLHLHTWISWFPVLCYRSSAVSFHIQFYHATTIFVGQMQQCRCIRPHVTTSLQEIKIIFIIANWPMFFNSKLLLCKIDFYFPRTSLRTFLLHVDVMNKRRKTIFHCNITEEKSYSPIEKTNTKVEKLWERLRRNEKVWESLRKKLCYTISCYQALQPPAHPLDNTSPLAPTTSSA